MNKRWKKGCTHGISISWQRWAIAFVWLAPLMPFALTAQTTPSPDTTILATPGARYAASALHQFFFGSNYRDLWATPIRMRALNLHAFAGGLTPVRSHSGSQTKSLRFKGANGRTYQFRGIDKDPTAKFSPEIQKAITSRILQDGVSSTHPFGGLVAASLLEAAGILHVEPELAVLPDDPALGEYRAEFAGTLGEIEERPNESEDKSESFAGTAKVIGSSRLFERLNKSPDDRVDARAFLAARLVDTFLGDRDRHRDNWRWAKLDGTPNALWQPISRDHDEAFVNLNGLLPNLAKFYFPQLVAFGPDYPSLVRLHWHGREVDRRFLVDLEKPVWDSTATALQARLTDAMIDEAVRHLPPEICAKNGAALSQALKQRRNRLTAQASLFYRFLAQQVEIHATDAAEVAAITRVDDHYLDVVISKRAAGASPYFRRRFNDRETKEIRLRMFGGDDRVMVRGAGNPRITLRLIGGDGNDELIDSTRTGGVRFYDAAGNNHIVGTWISRRPYVEWVGSDLDRYPPREWGQWLKPLPWLTAGADLGLFIGGGFSRTVYGFRKSPYASYISLRGEYATAARAGRVECNGDFRHENSSARTTVHARASGIDILHYYGLGNNTKASGSDEYSKVRRQQYTFEPALVLPLGANLSSTFGPTVTFSHLGVNEGRFISMISDTLYGAADFGQVGALLALRWDTRNRTAAPSKGILLAANARMFPKVWDVKSAFGRVDAQVATYLTAPIALNPTLALRVGGNKIWGTFPFHESAFVGGASTLRGWVSERFAGDAALYSNAELRLFLTKFFILLPGDFGVFGLADAGRVYVEGDSPGGWHTAAGGGIWFAFFDRVNTVSIGMAGSRERTALYAQAGFAF